jgi:hypothetical protein
VDERRLHRPAWPLKRCTVTTLTTALSFTVGSGQRAPANHRSPKWTRYDLPFNRDFNFDKGIKPVAVLNSIRIVPLCPSLVATKCFGHANRYINRPSRSEAEHTPLSEPPSSRSNNSPAPLPSMSSNPSNIASSSITIMKLQMLLWIQSLCGSLPDFPMIASDKKLRTIAFLIQNPTVGNPDPSPTGQLARLRTLHRYCITVLGSAYEALSRKAELVNTIGQLEAMHPCHQKKALEVMNGGNIVRAYHLTDIAVPPWAPREDSIAPTEVDPSSDRDEDFDVDDEDTAEGEVSGTIICPLFASSLFLTSFTFTRRITTTASVAAAASRSS